MPKEEIQELYKPEIVKQVVDDSHYYFVDEKFYPSVTTIIHESLPMPFELLKWYTDLGMDKADARRDKAADRGTLLHDRAEKLLQGLEIPLHDLPNDKDKKALVSIKNWFAEFQPKVLDSEQVVASTKEYAGTLDLECEIDNVYLLKNKVKPKYNTKKWIIDLKFTGGIYLAHKLQQIAYQYAKYEMTGEWYNIGILQANPRTKKGWTFYTAMEHKGRELEIGDFLKVYAVYRMLNGGVIPEPSLTPLYPNNLKLVEEQEAENEEN